jgi:F420-non-reducing hydrogenase iron-sulfur subunit
MELMTESRGSHVDPDRTSSGPRILVFSTNTISDPGIDLAGSSHMSYSSGVVVISLPCTSGIRPAWILRAIEHGFDGVFIASDGDECAYLPDCSKRASRIVEAAQQRLVDAGYQPQRVRLAAICSVCAEPFTKHVTQFGQALAELEPIVRPDRPGAEPATAAARSAPAAVAG